VSEWYRIIPSFFDRKSFIFLEHERDISFRKRDRSRQWLLPFTRNSNYRETLTEFYILQRIRGSLFTMELYCTPKSQYTTVKHSQKLFEHTYTSDPHGPGTLTPIEFFQQDLLWQSSNTHFQFLQSESFQTHQVNPSSGYRSTCTPQRHFGV
jgi:hypothetical protein